MFRGTPTLTGLTAIPLSDEPGLVWQFDVGAPVTATAAIHRRTAYVGTDDGRLLALELKTPQPLWVFESPDQEPIESSPAIVDEVVVYGDSAGVIRGLNIADGSLRWAFETQNQVLASPTPCGDRVVVGSYDGHLYCLRVSDGKLTWKYDVGERVHGTAAVADEHILVGACDAHLHVVRAADGKLIRRIALGSVTGSAAATWGKRVFLPTYGEEVLAIDWRAGRVLWRYRARDRQSPYLASAALSVGRIVVGGRDRHVRALDPQTGKEVWSFATRGRVDSSPVIAGNRVIVGSADGRIYLLDQVRGTLVWQFETGGDVYASPALQDGLLVIGTLDGMVYWFE